MGQRDPVFWHILRSTVFYLFSYRFAGIDSVVLGNNHVMDLGDENVNKTVATLKDNNIQFAGINYGRFASAKQVKLSAILHFCVIHAFG